MAGPFKRKRKLPSTKKQARGGGSSNARGRVTIKAHTRDPRGPNKGKKPVRVRRYKRGLPRK